MAEENKMNNSKQIICSKNVSITDIRPHAMHASKRIEIISCTMAQKMQLGARECPHANMFSLFGRFEGHFSKNSTKIPPVRKSQPNKKDE